MIRALTEEKDAAGLSLNKATERHAGLLDQLQVCQTNSHALLVLCPHPHYPHPVCCFHPVVDVLSFALDEI